METQPINGKIKKCPQCDAKLSESDHFCRSCGNLLQDQIIEDQFVGKNVRDYKVMEKLGEGGMGRTYLTQHTLLGSHRVIKIMHPWVAHHPDFPARFHREARLLANLDHPAIVTLHEFSYLDDGTPFMVMEFLKGETLCDHLEKYGPFSLKIAVSLITEICEGLKFAHESGIIHRDISPENILLVPDRLNQINGKLIDFGIAKVFADEGYSRSGNKENVTEKNLKTRTGIYIGKPGYGSPEQFRQIPDYLDIDERTDIFSFGIVLYEAISGKKLFPNINITAYLLSLIKYSESGPSTLDWTAIPLGFQTIIQHCIAYHPNDRYSSFSEILADIHEAYSHEVLSENSDTKVVKTVTVEKSTEKKRPFASRKSLFFLLSLFLLSLTFFVSKAVFFSHDSTIQNDISVGLNNSNLPDVNSEEIDSAITEKTALNDLNQKKVDELLQQMEAAMEKKHFTVPEGKSAYDLGRALLDIDPENEIIPLYFMNITQYYLDQAKLALSLANFEKTEIMCSRALKVMPDNTEIKDWQLRNREMKKKYLLIYVNGFELVLIPGGTFLMGSSESDTDSKIYPDECPRHSVTISPFYIMSTEVTNGQYKSYCNKTGAVNPTEPYPEFKSMTNYFINFPDNPVINVSWNEANSFARFYGLRLPTEAEWEYTARAHRQNLQFPWGNFMPDSKLAVENLADRSLTKWQYYTSYQSVFPNYDDGYVFTSPVKTFQKNPFGLFDIGGNVREWCQDYYDKNYYQYSPKKDPKGPQSGTNRVIRGGAWSSTARLSRCAFRQNASADKKSPNYGFRLALDFVPEEPLDSVELNIDK